MLDGGLTTGFFWHLHHEGGPLEYCYDLAGRKMFIRLNKTKITKRLRLLKPVRRAGAPHWLIYLFKCVAERACHEADIHREIKSHAKSVRRLHASQCGCPFYKNGGSIFGLTEE